LVDDGIAAFGHVGSRIAHELVEQNAGVRPKDHDWQRNFRHSSSNCEVELGRVALSLQVEDLRWLAKRWTRRFNAATWAWEMRLDSLSCQCRFT